MRLKLVPENTHLDFIQWRRIAFIGSLIALIGSAVVFFSMGLNFGIDFRGGVTVEIEASEPVDLGRVRGAVSGLGLGDVKVQEFGSPREIVVFVELQEADSTEDGAEENVQQAAAETVKTTLRELLGDDISIKREEIVGPKVSGELVQRGALAISLAIAFMLLYIWLRFEWQFSIGAIAALVHDVLLTFGVFALTQLEFNLSIVAAILTIVGYSMNDTVVVYDRVRENLRKYKKKPLIDVLNESINQTLSRTVMTSVTTLLALGSLYVLGGEVLRGFSFAMIWGVLVGTYSSIFIAAPLLLITGVKRDWSKTAAEGAPAKA
ncbi:MAG: protein translocase subunit SecF [Pseudomonadota bacterium]